VTNSLTAKHIMEGPNKLMLYITVFVHSEYNNFAYDDAKNVST